MARGIPNAVPSAEPASQLEQAAPTGPSSRRSSRLKASSYGKQAQNAPPLSGSLAMIDGRRNLAHVHFSTPGQSVPVGSRFRVVLKTPAGTQVAGEVEVVESFAGSATVRGLGAINLAHFGRDASLVR
jgi:hypothetical protein